MKRGINCVVALKQVFLGTVLLRILKLFSNGWSTEIKERSN